MLDIGCWVQSAAAGGFKWGQPTYVSVNLKLSGRRIPLYSIGQGLALVDLSSIECSRRNHSLVPS